MKIQPYLAALILITAGCSAPSDSPLEIATAFQLAIENENYKDAYNFIDDSLKEQTIPEDIEFFFNSENSVLTKPSKGFLLPVVTSYPTYRIIEFEETNPSDSCGITDIIVVRNRNDVWSVVWADHLSSEITLATDIHPLSTRNRFYKGGSYRGGNLSDLIPNERFIRLRRMEDELNLNAVFNLNRQNKWHRDGLYHIEKFMDPVRLIFHLGARPWVEGAIDTYLTEFQCSDFSERLEVPRNHDDILIGLAQYLLLHDKDVFWFEIGKNEKSDLLPKEGVDFGDFATLESPSKYWVLSSWLGSSPPDFGYGLSYEQKKKKWQLFVIGQRLQFVNDIRQQFESGRPDSQDLIKAIQLLAMVKDKSNPEYAATMAITEDIPTRVVPKISLHKLTSSELKICEDSFASLRELFPPFELEEFCSCIFHSSAGFETFIQSPGEYLKENEPCLKEYLFEPAEMTKADIKSYWKGVDRANQPVSKSDFAASCVKGVMPLLESSEAGYDEAYEFCLCIYDEADRKGLAMEELIADAGDDIANKCGHLIQP